jgi:hypothetical protein
MLQEPDALVPAKLPVWVEAVRMLGSAHVDILTRLLATETLGMLAAERLWKVAP